MQPKKNPKADLNQNRNLYFVIGLSLVLGITWGAIEYKSYEKAFDLSNIDMLEDDEEDIPITEQLKTPPPPPLVRTYILRQRPHRRRRRDPLINYVK